jgi:hypothetical protein
MRDAQGGIERVRVRRIFVLEVSVEIQPPRGYSQPLPPVAARNLPHQCWSGMDEHTNEARMRLGGRFGFTNYFSFS